MDESALISKFKQGDEGAFELLVRMHFRSAYNFAFRYMRDHSASDDVVQDSFLKAYKAIESFRGESSFKSWLLRIVRNTALNMIRSQAKREMVDMEDVALGVAHVEFKNMENLQTADLLKAAIEGLPPRQRIALELRVFEDLAFKEIAEIMECPFDTAKANYRHALLGLKKILQKANGGRGLEEARQAFESLAED